MGTQAISLPKVVSAVNNLCRVVYAPCAASGEAVPLSDHTGPDRQCRAKVVTTAAGRKRDLMCMLVQAMIIAEALPPLSTWTGF